MYKNRFGIFEPIVNHRAWLNPIQLDWIFLPLVAFNSSCYRLGMGGGFYDASLAGLRSRTYWQRPKLVGLAYEFQRIEHFAVEDWDVPLHGILTDERFYQARDLRVSAGYRDGVRL